MSSSEPVVVENMGKRYLVPHKGGDTRKDRMMVHLKTFLPFLRHHEDDYFWALRDLSFTVKPGEILGIMGRNGSGKSTLLKILSGITKPSTGRCILKGKVGSLLEVGTGFHPDLTGRENVLMSGVLLGISKQQIAARMDEIIDFSGIEPFIDVHVKRYSSGMYVRVAYAVASMLEAEILILDEVMSVGDAAFREKAQANMEKIAHDGRTILFVSHNSRAVNSLCTTGMILDKGSCIFEGNARDAVVKYMRSMHEFDTRDDGDLNRTSIDLSEASRHGTEGKGVLKRVTLANQNGTETNRFKTGSTVIFRIRYEGANVPDPYFSVLLFNEFAERVATIHSTHAIDGLDIRRDGEIECRIDDLRLGEGMYTVMLDYGNYGGSRLVMSSMDCIAQAAVIHVKLDGYLGGIGLDAFQGAAHQSVWKCC